jgi:methylmalonyl-CoA/ethylmalonyl-CoA epimerase
MTDGVVNVALLNFGTDTIPGQEERPGMKGLIHFGMWVDDLMETNVAIVAAGGTYMSGPLDGATTEPDGYYEVKYATPDGIVFDTTATGWRGAAKDVVPALETAPTKS